MNRSLRLRLTLLYSGLFALLFLFFALLLYGTLSHSLSVRLDETLASEVDTAAGIFADEYREMGGQAVIAAREVVSDMKLHDMVVVAEGDRVLASTAPLTVAEWFRGNRRIVERHVPIDGVTYRVLIGASLESMQAELAIVRRYIALGIPLALAFSGVGAWLLATRALRPLRSIAEQARQISENNLDQRITVREAAAELDSLIASFNDLLARLDRSFDTMRRFIADASHELRTPISVIRGEADVAISRDRPAEEYRESLATILDESRRLSRLTDDLLNLARVDAGHVKLQTREFYLNELLAGCCRSVRSLTAEHQLTLECLAAQDTQYCGDEQLLRRLILNLLDNAIHYTPSGGRITAAIEATPATIRISVKDNGIGISPEQMLHIFERFYRVDESRSRAGGGFGLGLPIVKWIAEAHHGTVECASTPGQGSTFTVILPR